MKLEELYEEYTSVFWFVLVLLLFVILTASWEPSGKQLTSDEYEALENQSRAADDSYEQEYRSIGGR